MLPVPFQNLIRATPQVLAAKLRGFEEAPYDQPDLARQPRLEDSHGQSMIGGAPIEAKAVQLNALCAARMTHGYPSRETRQCFVCLPLPSGGGPQSHNRTGKADEPVLRWVGLEWQLI